MGGNKYMGILTDGGVVSTTGNLFSGVCFAFEGRWVDRLWFGKGDGKCLN